MFNVFVLGVLWFLGDSTMQLKIPDMGSFVIRTTDSEDGGNKRPARIVIERADGTVLLQRAFPELLSVRYRLLPRRDSEDAPLVLVTAGAFGGSDDRFETTVFAFIHGGFREVLTPPIETNRTFDEGAICLIPPRGKTPIGLLAVNFAQGPDEAHVDPHRFTVDRYSWTNGTFIRTAHHQTTRRHSTWRQALSEMRLECNDNIVASLFPDY